MIRFCTLLLAALLSLPLAVTSAEAKTAASAPQVHVVKQGDTLGAIAQRHGLSVNDLKRLNGLNSSKLKIGQKLALVRKAAPPAAEPLRATAKAAAAEAPAPQAAPVGREYRVRSGDSLYSIARTNNLSVDTLKRLNGLRSDKLSLGQRLLLEPGTATAAAPAKISRPAAVASHVVKKGDTLHSIARRHGIAIADLKLINDLSSDRLKIGQRLALSGRDSDPSSLLRPGDADEDEVLEMAYKAASDLEQIAFNYLSTPYRFGGNSRKGIDCSAFVQSVFRDIDIKLPRSAREQFKVGQQVDRDELQPGDLLFFKTYAKFPSHVGIYLGDGRMIHASSRSRRVVVTDIDYPYYVKRYIGAKRITLLDQGDDRPEDDADEELDDFEVSEAEAFEIGMEVEEAGPDSLLAAPPVASSQPQAVSRRTLPLN